MATTADELASVLAEKRQALQALQERRRERESRRAARPNVSSVEPKGGRGE